jgi:hypothetical protein
VPRQSTHFLANKVLVPDYVALGKTSWDALYLGTCQTHMYVHVGVCIASYQPIIVCEKGMVLWT